MEKLLTVPINWHRYAIVVFIVVICARNIFIEAQKFQWKQNRALLLTVIKDDVRDNVTSLIQLISEVALDYVDKMSPQFENHEICDKQVSH